MNKRHLCGLLVAALLVLSAGCGKSPNVQKPGEIPPPRPENVKQLNKSFTPPQEVPAGQ